MIATYRHTAFEHEEFIGVDGADFRVSDGVKALPVIPEIRKTRADESDLSDIWTRDRMDIQFYTGRI